MISVNPAMRICGSMEALVSPRHRADHLSHWEGSLADDNQWTVNKTDRVGWRLKSLGLGSKQFNVVDDVSRRQPGRDQLGAQCHHSSLNKGEAHLEMRFEVRKLVKGFGKWYFDTRDLAFFELL
jgi:hypothetical protein